MLINAYAQAEEPAADPVFSASFYAPYEAALAQGLAILGDARRAMAQDVLSFGCRLKSAASIRGKLLRKHLPQTAASAGAALRDIAGLRAVLASRSAVYRYADLLLGSDALMLEEIHDYIAAPKPSGYRSLHLIARVCVSMPQGVYTVPIEIQLRTAAMDAWACAEHALIYKPRTQPPSSI
ncbi:MAG: hypothetical protein IKU38_01720 [Clostridia bacterium]|nr:hypothetical protein [Clostridia bacterium]